jgi:hypothetical protein
MNVTSCNSVAWIPAFAGMTKCFCFEVEVK